MGSAASTSGIISLNDLKIVDPQKVAAEDLTRTNSNISLCAGDIDCPEGSDPLFHEFQFFVSQVKSDNITVRQAGEFVTKYPKCLFVFDYEGKSAIQHAGENRNIPLFHLLIKKKQEERRRCLEVSKFNTP